MVNDFCNNLRGVIEMSNLLLVTVPEWYWEKQIFQTNIMRSNSNSLKIGYYLRPCDGKDVKIWLQRVSFLNKNLEIEMSFNLFWIKAYFLINLPVWIRSETHLQIDHRNLNPINITFSGLCILNDHFRGCWGTTIANQ